MIRSSIMIHIPHMLLGTTKTRLLRWIKAVTWDRESSDEIRRYLRVENIKVKTRKADCAGMDTL